MSPPRPLFAAAPDEAFWDECFALISARTGLQVRAKDRASLSRALAARLESLKIGAFDYLQTLRRQKVDEGEWTALMPHLTNGESYFQRDRGQFELLRTTILPSLIERRRAAGESTLRLWSAGCSTGEEAFSLAMTAEALVPKNWKLVVLGTDINSGALQKARRAVYGAWSFRGVANTTRDAYFRAVSGGYEVAPALRERVSFAFCNLSANDWPDNSRGLADIDLIVCRNVLIYFERESVAGVVERFTRTLRQGGCLLTGHAELHDQSVAPLQARLFPESAVYEKEVARPAQIPAAFPRPARLAEPPIPTSASALPTPRAAPQPKVALLSKTANEWFQEARMLADSGQLGEARRCCRGAVEADPSHTGAYLLWAHVAEEEGLLSQAKELLKKVIYLVPLQPEAYVELGAIYGREGDSLRARQMRLSALELLRAMAPTQIVSRGASAAELMNHIRNLLNENLSSQNVKPSPGARR